MPAKNSRTTSDFLSYSEYLRLLDRLHDSENYFFELYAIMSFCTACRSSDVLKFKWQDVYSKDRIIVTEQKTGKTRPILIGESTKKRILKLYVLLGEPPLNSYMFRSRKSSEPVSIQYINRKLKIFKYAYGLKIDNFSSHTFRKTFGRYVYDRDDKKSESLILLNKIFKHSSIAITQIYLGITQGEIDDVFRSIKL